MKCQICNCTVRNVETHFNSKKHLKNKEEKYNEFTFEIPELICLVRKQIQNNDLNLAEYELRIKFIKSLKKEIEEKRKQYDELNMLYSS